jgi:hypothetical protein
MSFDEEKIWHRKIAMAILWQSPMIYVLLRYVVPGTQRVLFLLFRSILIEPFFSIRSLYFYAVVV